MLIIFSNSRGIISKILSFLSHQFNRIPVKSSKVAHLLVRLIPSQCPFERDITLLGHLLFHIPALCKLNPFYDDLQLLRFRALSYLADVCGEDITPLISH